MLYYIHNKQEQKQVDIKNVSKLLIKYLQKNKKKCYNKITKIKDLKCLKTYWKGKV